MLTIVVGIHSYTYLYCWASMPQSLRLVDMLSLLSTVIWWAQPGRSGSKQQSQLHLHFQDQEHCREGSVQLYLLASSCEYVYYCHFYDCVQAVKGSVFQGKPLIMKWYTPKAQVTAPPTAPANIGTSALATGSSKTQRCLGKKVRHHQHCGLLVTRD